jgi:hypothetical protein
VRSSGLKRVVQPESRDASVAPLISAHAKRKRASNLIIYDMFFVVVPFLVTVVAMIHDFVYLHSAEHLRPKMRATPPMGIDLSYFSPFPRHDGTIVGMLTSERAEIAPSRSKDVKWCCYHFVHCWRGCVIFCDHRRLSNCALANRTHVSVTIEPSKTTKDSTHPS